MTDENRLKIIIVGDGSCGKTVLLCAYIDKHIDIDADHVPTVLDTYLSELEVNQQTIVLEISDTAGQEDLEQIRQLVYPGSHVVILCYSCISDTTLNNVVGFWYPELQADIPDVPIVLSGNKLDLREGQERKYVGLQEVNKKIKGLSAFKASLQCSAFDKIKRNGKDGGRVESVFQNAVKYGLEYRFGMEGCRCCCCKCVLL